MNRFGHVTIYVDGQEFVLRNLEDVETWLEYEKLCDQCRHNTQEFSCYPVSADRYKLLNKPPIEEETIQAPSPLKGACTQNPPVGQRTRDYAYRAVPSFIGRSFTLEDLGAEMRELGWATRSQDWKNTLASSLRKTPGFYHQGKGQWVYMPEEAKGSPTGSPMIATEEKDPVRNGHVPSESGLLVSA